MVSAPALANQRNVPIEVSTHDVAWCRDEHTQPSYFLLPGQPLALLPFARQLVSLAGMLFCRSMALSRKAKWVVLGRISRPIAVMRLFKNRVFRGQKNLSS